MTAALVVLKEEAKVSWRVLVFAAVIVLWKEDGKKIRKGRWTEPERKRESMMMVIVMVAIC